MNVFRCVCPSGAFPWGSPSLGLFSPSPLQKVSNPKNGAVHLPAPAHRHVETVYMSDPCCVGLPNGPFQLNATAVTTFDCLKNTLPTTRCGVLKVITMMLFCHHAFGDNTLQDWKNERPRKIGREKKYPDVSDVVLRFYKSKLECKNDLWDSPSTREAVPHPREMTKNANDLYSPRQQEHFLETRSRL